MQALCKWSKLLRLAPELFCTASVSNEAAAIRITLVLFCSARKAPTLCRRELSRQPGCALAQKDQS